MNHYLQSLIEDYPELNECVEDIILSINILIESFSTGGKLLLCGNGGSAADCSHIVGELMKSFIKERSITASMRENLIKSYPEGGEYLSIMLQEGFPALSMCCQNSLLTAISNDIAADMIFAQQVYVYGKKGDVLLGLSTSGNSDNILNAFKVGRVIGLNTIGLTGKGGGEFPSLCDCSIIVPVDTTASVQERHLPIYHAICKIIEEELFT